MTSELSTGYLQTEFRNGWWPYLPGRGESLEATAWCAIACRNDEKLAAQAVRHIISRQNADGGWSTAPDVDGGRSDWSSGLALLALNILQRQPSIDQRLSAQIKSCQERGFKKLTAQRADVITDLTRVGMMVMQGPDFDYPRGWPWAADTYNWVEPTAYALLAIKSGPYAKEKRYQQVVSEAQQYLFDKACSVGGWNFGAPRTLGADWPPMPPPTALALIAMQDVKHKQIDKALGYLRSLSGPSVTSLMGQSLSLIARSLHGEDTGLNAAASAPAPPFSGGENLATIAMATIAANLHKEGNPLKLA